MLLLKSKLLVIAKEQRAAEVADIKGDIVEAAWGQSNKKLCFPSLSNGKRSQNYAGD